MNRRQRREAFKKRKSVQKENTQASASANYRASWRGLGKYEKVHHEEEELVPGDNCPPLPTIEFQSQLDHNIWHNREQIDRFIETIKRLSVEDDYDWSWAYNSRCKYVNLRFDMRDGGFILTNDEGHRIELPQLEWQWKAAKE